jgi:hypothetical protein
MKFKYGDQVKVKEGFYEGLNGFVDDFRTYHLPQPEYYVELKSYKGEKINTLSGRWILEDLLEKIS